MKKGFALLLAMVLMLTGCGSFPASTGTNVSAEAAKETEKELQTEAAGQEASAAEAADAEQTESVENASEKETASSSDTLVIYFSRTGEQYVVGVIDKGNTAIVAEMIAEQP